MTKITTIIAILATVLSAPIFAFAASAPSLGNYSVNVTGSHNVSINVSVNPNGSSTNVYFKYWTGSKTYPDSIYSNLNGTSWVNTQNWGLINLIEGTTYSYQIVAINSFGSASTQTGTFSTTGSSGGSGSTSSNTSNNSGTSGTSSNSGNPTSPSVATNGPASVSSTSAVINGSVNPNNLATTFWFDFGTTQSLGQKTSLASVGSGNYWQLVTGNLSGLENGRTYYYRIAAQNSYGINVGEIKSFTTGTNSSGQTNGQVLGAVSGSTNGTSGSSGTGSNTNNNTSGTGATVKTQTGSKITPSPTPLPPEKSRPSFVSLEYSLQDKGALVVVAEELKPKPGEVFDYTVVYKNDSQYSYNEANLKVIIPVEAEYISADREPSIINGNTIEFGLDSLAPGSQASVVITVMVKSTTEPGTNLIFTSVLGYKDRFGTQLATTSYLTMKVASGSSTPLSASISSLFKSAIILWVIAIALIIALALASIYLFRKRKNRNGAKDDKEDLLGFGGMPPTFQPIDPVGMIKR